MLDDFLPDSPLIARMEFRHSCDESGHYYTTCLFCGATFASAVVERDLESMETTHALGCWKKKPTRVDGIEIPRERA